MDLNPGTGVNPPKFNNKFKLDIKSKPVILVTVVIAGLLAGGFWYWQSRKKEQSTGLGSQLFERVQNPIKNRAPDTNPFDVQSNPFGATDINPLKQIIKNPF